MDSVSYFYVQYNFLNNLSHAINQNAQLCSIIIAYIHLKHILKCLEEQHFYFGFDNKIFAFIQRKVNL